MRFIQKDILRISVPRVGMGKTLTHLWMMFNYKKKTFLVNKLIPFGLNLGCIYGNAWIRIERVMTVKTATDRMAYPE